VADAAAALGCGATRLDERLLASVGVLPEATLEFAPATDVAGGGVLCALPALLLEGLLRHSRTHFALPPGYYPLETIFLVLAFMALARLRSVEALRYEPPGEWGKLVGLDRIPEVRTLRAKLAGLCAKPEAATAWSAALAHDWMSGDGSESAGVFCVDGHVRVYHGALTKLPRRYVTRERLCLRGTTDYWTNALDGRPFFVVTLRGRSRTPDGFARGHRPAPARRTRGPGRRAGCRRGRARGHRRSRHRRRGRSRAALHAGLRSRGLFAALLRGDESPRRGHPLLPQVSRCRLAGRRVYAPRPHPGSW